MTVATDRDELVRTLADVRAATVALVEPYDEATLEAQLDPILSPLVWDLGHIAAYEDLWLVHRHGGEPLLHPELAALYDAFETPRAVRGDLELLRTRAAYGYLDAVRERTLRVLDARGPDATLHPMVLRHELQHTETMRQVLWLAGLASAGPPPLDGEDGWRRVQGGTFAMGAESGGFAYDNERPRHAVDVPAFEIARRPVTVASWASFAEGGGYERREWWSDEGWAWKQEYDITCPGGWSRQAHPDAPVEHVSWFEADAFARSQGARLPTEAEWEKAATSDQGLDGTGLVWEWTSSPFTGYPGFTAHPYREYSEVFFGDRHRVLRGGSWAASPLVATPTFRNWDLPQRRQIFAGVRLARDPTPEGG